MFLPQSPTTRNRGLTVNNKEPNHHDGSPTGSRLGTPLILILSDEDGNDDVAGRHADGADGQDRPPADAINPEHGRDGEDKHDDADDAGSQESSCRRAHAKF